jgi:hypothetical protein
MQRATVVIMVVLLCYVSVLNFVVANYLYRQYSVPGRVTPRLMWRASSASVRDAAQSVHKMISDQGHGVVDNGQDVAVRDVLMNKKQVELVCAPHAHVDIAVRVRRLATVDSNDARVAPSVLMLSELRQRLLAGIHTRQENVRVWLVMRPEDFLGLFRLWCVALGADSRGRLQCEVLFTEPAQHSAIAWLLVHRQPCTLRLLVLDEDFHVPLLAHINAMLVVRGGPDDARLQVLDTSRAPLGRESMLLPGCFLRECVRRRCRLAPGLESDADLAEFAGGARAGLVCRV